MRKLVAILLAATALTACGTPPQTRSRGDGLAPGCYTARSGQAVCPQAAPSTPIHGPAGEKTAIRSS
jgi:hypothetical protein